MGQVRDTLHAPGVIVGLAINAAEPIVVANGVRDAISHRALLAMDRLRVGSVTKTFTAVAVLQLVEAGAFENHLFPPGSNWADSNTNYILLGMIIEAVTQKSLARAFRHGIFDPLKMTHTFLDGKESIPDGFAPGYASNPENPSQSIDLTHVMHVSAAWAAGGIVSTADDVLTFDRALFGGRLVQPDTFVRMKDFVGATNPIFPFVDGYGLGLVSMHLDGKLVYGHLGNIPGYSSLMAYLPSSDLYIAILMNQNFTQTGNQKVNVEIVAEAVLQVIATKES